MRMRVHLLGGIVQSKRVDPSLKYKDQMRDWREGKEPEKFGTILQDGGARLEEEGVNT